LLGGLQGFQVLQGPSPNHEGLPFVGEILFDPAFSKYVSSGHYLVSRGPIHDFSSPFSIRFHAQRLFKSVQLTGFICGEADRDLTGGDSA
jgi:hypothetical protein